MHDLKNKTVLVLGHKGFLGKYVAAELTGRGANVQSPAMLDLRYTCLHNSFDYFRPDYIVNVAGRSGNIAMNQQRPLDVFYNNSLVALNVIRACVDMAKPPARLIQTVSSCGGPDREVLSERDYLSEHPHPATACHGYAKRNALLAADYAREQYGLDTLSICFPTLFGPGESMDELRGKVVGSLCRKFVLAARDSLPEVVLWGTGTPLRDILYVKDAAKVLVDLMIGQPSPRLVNVSSGDELTVREMSLMIARHAMFTGSISWDTSRKDGQYRKRLDNKLLGTLMPRDYSPFTPLDQAMAETVRYYREVLS